MKTYLANITVEVEAENPDEVIEKIHEKLSEFIVNNILEEKE